MATSHRAKKTPSRHEIIWLTGQSGSGKTTLARALQKKIGGVVLDGDEMRESISRGAGFTKKDRHEHNMRVARLAMTLSKQTKIIVSVIAPFETTRRDISALIKPLWVYVYRKRVKRGSLYPYEVPRAPHLTIDIDSLSLTESIRRICGLLKRST